nr:pentatricopeptide repeat protein AaPPR280 [Agave angustifolia]
MAAASPSQLHSLSYSSSSLLSPWLKPPKTRNPSLYPSLNKSSSLSPKLSVQTQQPETQNPNPPFKNSIWVNPNSPRAPLLRRHSSDSRYARLSKLAQSLNSPDLDESAIANLLNSLRPNPTEQDAVIVLDNMENTTNALAALSWFQNKIKVNKEVILYNVTLKVVRKSKNWSLVESFLKKMIEKGVQPDNVTFSTVISCARFCNLPAKAVEWFERMPEFGLNPDYVTYSAMIDAYGRAGSVEKALGLYDRARREKWLLDPVTFSTVIRVYGTSGNFDGALNVYEEMKALGVKPNVVMYNTLLDAMGKAGRPWQVKTIYKEMDSNGLVPNRITYAALLRAYSRARYAEDALGVYREMKEKGFELNIILYNMLLSMCADIGLVDEAVEIFEEMKGLPDGQKPDSWSYSSLITAYSCIGKVSEAEGILDEMLEAGFQPNIFVLTSLIQCYGKARKTDDVVRTFNRLLEMSIVPDDRFCGCLLNVVTQTPTEEIDKVIGCIEKANVELGSLVKLLVDEGTAKKAVKLEASELFGKISKEVKKAYCNCLIDLCVNLNLLERACVLLELALELGIYSELQLKSPTQWSLHVRGLSFGAALTALHIWMNDLSKALEDGEELPPLLGIHTGHGKHKYSERGLAAVFESHLRELSAPFHETPDKVGWFLTTKVAAKSWLDSRSSSELVAA